MTEEDFAEFVNSVGFNRFRQYILEEISVMENLTNSNLLSATIESNAYAKNLSTLEALGLDSVMRLAAVKGLDYAIDVDSFHDYVFGGENV